MSTDRVPTVKTNEKNYSEGQSVDWKEERNQKKFYEPITFKGIKIGYSGDLLDDENIPF